jgi:hypothetical protein
MRNLSRISVSRPILGKATFRALDGSQQLCRPIGNELGHYVTRPVPLFDLCDSIRGADWLTIRRSRQIEIPQRIPDYPKFIGEDCQQVTNPAELGFQNRVGMPGNQIHDTFRTPGLQDSGHHPADGIVCL